MAAYVLVFLTINDETTYARYRSTVGPTIVAHGGRLALVDDAFDVLEGATDAGRVIVLEFPDRAAAHEWYQSPEYRAIKHDRLDSTTTEVVVVAANSPETQARLDATNAAR